MSSRNMCLLPRATLYSDSEQFIYNWMLEDDLGLDWGDRKEAKQTRGKADNPVSRARSRSAKKAQGTKGIYANQSRDVDSRKLILSVMLDQGRQKRLRKQTGIVMQTKSWWGFTQTKSCQSCWIKVGKKGSGTKGIYAKRTDIHGKPNLELVRYSSGKQKEKGNCEKRTKDWNRARIG